MLHLVKNTKYQPIYSKAVVKLVSKYVGHTIDSYMTEIHSFKSQGYLVYIVEYLGKFYCCYYNDRLNRYVVSEANWKKVSTFVNSKIEEERNNEE